MMDKTIDLIVRKARLENLSVRIISQIRILKYELKKSEDDLQIILNSNDYFLFRYYSDCYDVAYLEQYDNERLFGVRVAIGQVIEPVVGLRCV